MERIIMDEENDDALNFIKSILERIKQEENLKLKSHLDSADPVGDFQK